MINLFRIAFYTSRIHRQFPYLLSVIKLDNTLSSVALRRRIHKENNGVISRGCNTCALTQSAVSQGLSVCSASAHVCTGRNVCVYVDAANRYTALQHVYTARLHVLPRDSLLPAAQQWAIASSAARQRCRLGEGESTNDVRVLS